MPARRARPGRRTPTGSSAPCASRNRRRPGIPRQRQRTARGRGAVGGEFAVLDGLLGAVDLAVGRRPDATVDRPSACVPARRLRHSRKVHDQVDAAADRSSPAAPRCCPSVAEVALVRHLAGADDVGQVAVATADRLAAIDRPGADEAPAGGRVGDGLRPRRALTEAVSHDQSRPRVRMDAAMPDPSVCVQRSRRCPSPPAGKTIATRNGRRQRGFDIAWAPVVREGARELRASLPSHGASPSSARPPISRRIGGHPIKALKKAGYTGRHLSHQSEVPELHGLTCFPDVRSIEQPCDLAIVAVPAPGVAQRDPRLRQGRHSLRGGADGRLPRDAARRARKLEAELKRRRRRERRARHRPQLPGRAVGAVARVGCLRQRRRRDRFAAGLRVVRVPVRAASATPSSTWPRRRAWAFAIASRPATRPTSPCRSCCRPSSTIAGTSLAFAYMEGTPDARPPARRRPQVAGDRQAGADLEGRHHRCRHQGRRLAHRQHDRQLRSLPRGACASPA